MQEPHNPAPPAPDSGQTGQTGQTGQPPAALPPEQPAAQPPVQTPSPAPRASLPRRVLRRGMWLALGLLAVLALALGGLWVWSATDESLNTLLHLVQRHMPAGSSLELEGVSGSLRRGGHIRKLVYRLHDTPEPTNQPDTPDAPGHAAPAPTGALTITLENTDIRWSWAALRHRATQLRQLHVRTLTVTDTRAAKADKTPATPLTQLVLPVGVDAPFTIDTLRITRAQGAAQTLTGLQGHYRYDHARAQHQLTVTQLRYLQGDYSLQATLGGQAPMPLQWQAQARLALPAPSRAAPADGATPAPTTAASTASAPGQTPNQTTHHTVQIALNGHGTLAGADARLHIEAQAQTQAQSALPAASASVAALPSAADHAAPATATSAATSNTGGAASDAPPALLALQADIRPWQQQILAGAQAQWQHINLQAFWPQAPQTLLQGRLELKPQASTDKTETDNAPTAQADPVAQALGFLGTARWQATLHASNAHAGPLDQQRLPLHALTSTVQYHRGDLQLQAFNWQPDQEGGHISGQGRYQAAQGWQGQWQLHQLHPSAFYSAVQAAPLQGTITVRSDAEAQARAKAEALSRKAPAPSAEKPSGQSPETPSTQPLLTAPIAVEVALQSLTGRDTRLLHFDAIHVQGLWHEQLLQLPRIAVRSRGGTLQGQASYHAGTQAAQADLKLQLPGSSGLLKGQLAPNSGQGQLRLDARNLRQTSQWLRPWPGMQFLHSRTLEGSAQLHASWRGGWHNNGQNMQLQARLHAPAVTVQTPASHAAAIQLRDITLAVQGSLARAQLQAAGQMQQGSRTLQLAVQGHGGKHGTGWQAQLQALQAQLRDTVQKQQWQAELAAAVPMSLEQSGQRLQLRTGAFHIRLHGATAAAATATAATAQAASIQGEPLLWLRQGNHYQIKSKGTVRGLPLAWLETLSGSAALDQALTGDMLLDGAWDVDLGQQLRLKAHLARSSGDIVVLAGASGQGRVAAGTRAARIDVQSTGSQIQAQLLWDSAQAGTANASLRTQLQRGAAGWTLPASAPLHGQLQARLPRVGIWNMFTPPGWRLRGSFNADVAFSGTLHTPLLHGTVQMDDVGVRSIVDGIAFTDGRLRARLSGQRMDIETFSLRGSPSRTGLLGAQRIEGGSLQLAGYTQWVGGPSLLESVRMQLTGKIEQLQLFTLPDRLIVLSGDVQAGLSGLQLTLRGGLRVNRALIELPDSSAPKLGDDVFIRPSSKHPKAALAQPAQQAAPARAQTTAPAATPTAATGLGDDVTVRPRAASSAANTATAARSAASAPPAKAATTAPSSATTRQTAASAGASVRPNPAIAADIQIGIDLGNNFRVRGRGLDTYLNGKLTVTGGPSISDLPRITGTVHTDRGSFRAYGQDLQIETGRILFTGAAANPTLDITALRSNLDIRVGVRIYGTAQQPTVQLFSDPAMPDSERLSWLVLGRSSYSAADAALLQQAAMALLGGDSRGITGQLADALGLDDINFKGGDTLGNSSVTLGKRFSKNFYVSYEKGLDATVGTLYFFLDLSRKLKLRAQTGQNSALDLIYTVSYD